MKHTKGFTLIELLVVIAVLGVLAAILLPTLARAREASHRASCASNLKQWGLTLKLYASEDAKGRYPRRAMHTIQGLPVLGMEADGLYPDYWTDLSIWRCPADMGDMGDWAPATGIDDGLLSQVHRLGAEEGVSQDCVLGLLSLAPSYIYVPWFVRGGSELVDAHLSLTVTPATREALTRAVSPGVNEDEMTTCGFQAGERFRVSVTDYGVDEIDSAVATLPGVVGRNDNGRTLPEHYRALSEGVARFALTDINSSLALQAAETTTVVMYDAWTEQMDGGSPWAVLGDASAAHRFNHIPSGSNVLYLDGHVAFVPLHAGFPLLTQSDYRQDSLAGQYWRTQSTLFGGWG